MRTTFKALALICLSVASTHASAANICKGRGLGFVALLNCELRAYVHLTGKCPGGYREVKATQYGYEGGRHTASGQVYNKEGHSAAHRRLPFGTQVNVINPHNGKSVVVLINDRGPATTAEFDLSTGAARTLGIAGSSAVCVER